MNKYTLEVAKSEAADLISRAISSPVKNDEIRYPPENIEGDLAFPCFPLAKIMKKNPAVISSELAENIKFSDKSLFDKSESKGGYLNFFLNKERFSESVINDFMLEKQEYGHSNIGKGKRVIIDYSSPNIAKPFSVGHLRSTNIGSALCNIMRFAGYEVIGDNHIGDWGTQFGKLIYAYDKWGDREAIEKDPIRELLKLYTRFHEEAGTAGDDEPLENGTQKENPLECEARNLFKKLEDKDSEIVNLWEWIREMSLSEFQKVYDELGIKFDVILGESFYNDKMDKVKQIAESKGVTERDAHGTILVRLDKYGIDTPLLIQKKDGTSLYATRDLACVLYRIEKWAPELILYVVGEEQSLYFRQLFKALELMGVNTMCEHIGFGLIVLPEGKLSTRKGRVIFLEDLIKESTVQSYKVLEGRDFDLKKKDEIAKIVGIGAIKYNDLSQNRKKTVTFEWEKMLSLEGNSSPYLQYSYTRAKSILRKAQMSLKPYNSNIEQTDEEILLLKHLAKFPEVIIDSACQFYPHIISNYLFELAQNFTAFYSNVPVIAAGDESLINNRLIIVDFFSQTMKTGLKLMGIDVMEEM